MPQKPETSLAPPSAAERLRDIRRQAGASQREFAAILGVSEATLQRAETGGAIGGDLLLSLTNEGWSADWVLQGIASCSLEATAENLALLERLVSAGGTTAPRAHRAAQFFEISRLVDAYEAALDRIKAPAGQSPDNYKLMELTLTLYDAFTISAEVMEAQKAPGKARR